MAKAFSPRWFYTPEGLKENICLQVTDTGRVLAMQDAECHQYAEKLPGILCPGFVNAHCHLELSHLHKTIPRHTGMAEFARNIITRRSGYAAEEIQTAARKALQGMQQAGIVAVGDIKNTADVLPVTESQTAVRFHHFAEVFGMKGEMAGSHFSHAESLREQCGKKSSIVPHAPYSVSPALRDMIWKHAAGNQQPVSVHLLESVQERELFETHTGPLAALFAGMGLQFDFTAEKNPARYILEHAPQDVPLLLVHNTEMQEAEILEWAAFPNVYFVLCPRANEFIHGTMPDARQFQALAQGRWCIGTDSLAGNDSLDVLEEIKTLSQRQPELPVHNLLYAAITAGAKALNMYNELGVFRTGNAPGLLHLYPVHPENGTFTPETRVEVLYGAS